MMSDLTDSCASSPSTQPCFAVTRKWLALARQTASRLAVKLIEDPPCPTCKAEGAICDECQRWWMTK